MENYNPLVSIVMPAYNCEKYIEQAIESVIHQTYNNWELLISDDGSIDGTYHKIQTFKDPRIRFIAKTENLGAFTAKNVLLREAQGEFITFLDSDDFMATNRVELQLKELLENKELMMVGCQVGYVDNAGKLIRTSSKPTSYKEVLDNIYKNNVIGGAVMFLRKSVIDEVGGGFRPYFKRLSYQDYDLSILVAERYPCYNLPLVLYYYRQHESSVSKVLQVDRVISKDVVMHLAIQRKLNGTDDLMDGNTHLVDAYFDKLREPYKKDATLIYRDYAANYMYNRLYVKAVKVSWRSVLLEPFKWVNWMTLQYCIRTSILKYLVSAY